MNFDALKNKSVEELRTLAVQCGLEPHHRMKAETLVKMIIDHATNPPKPEELKHPAEKVKLPTVIHTEEEVRELVKQYAEKEGYQVTFPGDDTVIFKYKGAEDSCHLSSTPRNIKMRAETVSHGERKIRTVDLGDGKILAVG